MKTLRKLLTKPLNNIPTGLVVVLLIIALIGFVDSTYLTIKNLTGSIPPCSVLEGCETVLTSKYAEVAGIPVALMGSIFYLVVLIGLFACLESKRYSILPYILILTIIGFSASLWFVFIQIFVIGSICLYCMGSAITSTLLFVLTAYAYSKYGTKEIGENSGHENDSGYKSGINPSQH